MTDCSSFKVIDDGESDITTPVSKLSRSLTANRASQYNQYVKQYSRLRTAGGKWVNFDLRTPVGEGKDGERVAKVARWKVNGKVSRRKGIGVALQ